MSFFKQNSLFNTIINKSFLFRFIYLTSWLLIYLFFYLSTFLTFYFFTYLFYVEEIEEETLHVEEIETRSVRAEIPITIDEDSEVKYQIIIYDKNVFIN